MYPFTKVVPIGSRWCNLYTQEVCIVKDVRQNWRGKWLLTVRYNEGTFAQDTDTIGAKRFLKLHEEVRF